LADFSQAWRKITANRTVLSDVSGAKILFTSPPSPSLSSFAQPRFSDSEASQVDQFVEKLVLAQVITVVKPKSHQIVSPITTNHDGSLCLIFNMKKINEACITTTHFKLETLQQILPLIPRGAWFTSWDLVQGFYNVLVHHSQRHFFCFDWRGVRYQFRALPMGCSESPRIFSKVVRAVVYRARALGINVFSYLDNTLTFDLDYATTKAKSYQFADLLTYVGFHLHKDKSVRNPTQRILFLGFIIDSRTLTLEIPHEKLVAIQDLVRSALQIIDDESSTPIRFLAQVVGKLISLLPATRYGKAHYRALEYARDQALFRSNHDFDAEITWPTFCRADLEWWLALSHPVTVSFESPRFSIHMTFSSLSRNESSSSGPQSLL
jgi:hypothetical protein